MKIWKHIIATLTALLLGFASAHAGVVVLKNGDTLSGKIVEDSATEVIIESPILGTLTLAKTDVESVAKTIEDESGDSAEEEAAPEPPAPEVEKSLSEYYWENLTQTIFPKGFSGKFLLGYNYSESSDVQSGVQLGLEGKYERGKHTVTGDIFYAYTRKKDANGNVTKPTDKYGLNAAYEYDIKDPFFLRGSEKFLVDRVKKIEAQNDLNALGGWRALDEEKLSLDFAVGPGVRYLKTSSSEGEWSPLVTFNQKAFYQFSDSIRFNELFNYSVDPSDTGSYSLLFEVSSSIRLTPFAEPTIIYRNSYDSTVGAGGVKREQSLLVALILPF